MTSIWNVSKVRSFAVALAAGALLMVGYSQESRADQCGGDDGQGTYAELVAVGSCTIGDKTFSGFSFLSQDITSTAVSFKILNGPDFWGFTFQFGLSAFAGEVKDFSLEYDIACTNGSACIDSLHAAMLGGSSTGGAASLDERYYSPGNVVAGSFNLSNPGPQQAYNVDFTPVVTLHIMKDIQVSCPNVTTFCNASFSVVTNTVDQVTVPEPGTLALLAGGLLALGWTGRRRRGDRV